MSVNFKKQYIYSQVFNKSGWLPVGELGERKIHENETSLFARRKVRVCMSLGDMCVTRAMIVLGKENNCSFRDWNIR